MRDFANGWADLDGFHQQGLKWPRVRELFSAMGERGWLSLAWPKEDGGLGLPPSYEYILWDEIGYARLARNPLSSGIVAKTIVRHGTPEQKQRWLPGIKKGEIHFSLGYSEPEAGSDLTGLRTRAEKNGAGYIINGQKCWQSYAQDMDCLWLLARTGTQESRGRGLSLFIVPLDAAGLTVNPLPTLDGDQLNEIFLEDVEVAEDARVGPEDGAWKISFRSRGNIDVSLLAERFGGGGHRNAAGCTIQGSPEDVMGIASLARCGTTLSFIGNTDTVDYNDFVIAPGHETMFFDTLLDSMEEQQCSTLKLLSIRETSPTLTYLPDLARRRG